jgi:hypothetical protein
MKKNEFLKRFDELLENDTITVSIKNPNMESFELISFLNVDFTYKRKFYSEAYDDDMKHVMNNTIQITGIH